jgi:hypothetical protein
VDNRDRFDARGLAASASSGKGQQSTLLWQKQKEIESLLLQL